MDFARSALFDAPVPDESMRVGVLIDLSRLPNAENSLFVKAARDVVARDARGFSQTSTIFFQSSGPLDPKSLPDVAGTTARDAAVQIVDVDSASPARGSRTPAEVTYAEDGGPYGAPDMLGITPYQGRPLRAATLYAAVVLRRVTDRVGRALGRSPSMAALAKGQRPDGMSDATLATYRAALDTLAKDGIATGDLAALAVFRTDDWAPSYQSVLADAVSRPKMADPLAPKETFDKFCVYAGTIDMPVYQGGAPPYASTGGEWMFDASGKPMLQRLERANIVVTVPRAGMPADGFPTVVFSRPGAGGERPLVDRGVQAMSGGPAITPGTGPALEFARAGFAAISIDGPLGGLRNPDKSDEQFLIFNIGNPVAIRDNVRQSAVELAITAHLLDGLTVDASSCPDVMQTARFDTKKVALFGHSMGATIAPLALAFEPRFGAAILSGAGGSWIENVLYKQKPLAVRPLAELLVGYTTRQRQLAMGDPALALVQWAAEAADPPVWGDRIVVPLTQGRARHVLMIQGIVDHYILPPMANASSLSFGLDLAGPELDDQVAEVANAFTPLGKALALSGHKHIALPATKNITHADGSASTAVVVQHAADGVEDGHEVAFQRPEAKYQYRCFLSTWSKTGTPVVPEGKANDEVCP
jgi:pimeloyl-ACP methyl ester carboxylesterase